MVVPVRSTACSARRTVSAWQQDDVNVLINIKSWIGISSYDVSLEKQEVIVKGKIPYDDLLEKIKKTGKEVC